MEHFQCGPVVVCLSTLTHITVQSIWLKWLHLLLDMLEKHAFVKCAAMAWLCPWAQDDGGVGGNAVAELAAGAGDVQPLLARWRQQLQRLDEPPQHDEQHGNGEHDPGARPSADAKWKEPEVVPCQLHLGHGRLAVQEALGHELVGLRPILGVIGDPPRVYKHLA